MTSRRLLALSFGLNMRTVVLYVLLAIIVGLPPDGAKDYNSTRANL